MIDLDFQPESYGNETNGSTNRVEICRIELLSTLLDQIIVLATYEQGKYTYEIQDDYEQEINLPFSTSTKPLSLQELINLLNKSSYKEIHLEYGEGGRGIVLDWLYAFPQETQELLQNINFVRVYSSHYPELHGYYEIQKKIFINEVCNIERKEIVEELEREFEYNYVNSIPPTSKQEIQYIKENGEKLKPERYRMRFLSDLAIESEQEETYRKINNKLFVNEKEAMDFAKTVADYQENSIWNRSRGSYAGIRNGPVRHAIEDFIMNYHQKNKKFPIGIFDIVVNSKYDRVVKVEFPSEKQN